MVTWINIYIYRYFFHPVMDQISTPKAWVWSEMWGSQCCTLLCHPSFLIAVFIPPPLLLGFANADLSGVATSTGFCAATALWDADMVDRKQKSIHETIWFWWTSLIWQYSSVCNINEGCPILPKNNILIFFFPPLKTWFYYNFFGDEMTKGVNWMKEMISNMLRFFFQNNFPIVMKVQTLLIINQKIPQGINI